MADQLDPWEQAAGPSAAAPAVLDPWESPESPAASSPGSAQFAGPDWSTFNAKIGPVPIQIDPARDTGIGFQSLVSGAENTLGLPGNLEALAGKLFPNQMAPIESALGGDADSTFFPTSADMRGFTDNLGVTDSPGLTPAGGEKYLAAGAGGAGAGLVAGGLRGVGPGALGGVASQAASDLLPNVPWAPVVAGLLGGFGYQAADVNNFLSRTATLPGVNKEFDAATAAMASARAQSEAAAQATQAAAASRASAVASDLGSSTRAAGTTDSYTTAGMKLQKAVQDWQNKNGITGGGPAASGPTSPVTLAPSILSAPPEAVANRVISAGPGQVMALRAIAPNEVDNLASAMLTPQIGKFNPSSATFESESGLPAWGKIQDPALRAALVPDPAMRAELDSALHAHIMAGANAAATQIPAAERLAAATAAKNAIAPPAKPNALGAILGEQLGRDVIGPIAQAHGVPAWLAQPAGAIIGAASGKIFGGAKNALFSPQSTIIGGIAGQNPSPPGSP